MALSRSLCCDSALRRAPDEAALKATLLALVADTAVASGEVWIAVDPRGSRCRKKRNFAAATTKSKPA